MSKTIFTLRGRLLALALAITISLGWCCSAMASVMSWADLNDGNIGDWTGDTRHSSGGKTNFFNTKSASDNTLIIQNARDGASLSPPLQINGDIYGGYSQNTDLNPDTEAIDNNVVIVRAPTSGKDAAISPKDNSKVNVYGGFKYNPHAATDITRSISNNTVIIESGVNLGRGTVAGATVYNDGGDSNSLERVHANFVIIHGGTMSRIFGAAVDILAPNLLTVADNNVSINLRDGGVLTIDNSGATTGTGTVYGGDFHGGSVTNNRVEFYADDSSAVSTTTSTSINIIGGRSGFHPGYAVGNSVQIDISARTTSPAITFNNITGGSSGNDTRQEPSLYGGNTAFTNDVSILGNVITVGDVVGGKAYSGIATNNSVNLTDVTAEGRVIGGHTVDSWSPDTAKGIADSR